MWCRPTIRFSGADRTLSIGATGEDELRQTAAGESLGLRIVGYSIF